MDQKTLVKQVLDYQKNTIDSFLDSTSVMQDQAEKSWSFILERNPWMPEESKDVIREWGNIARKSRDDFKQILDNGFDRMESYLATTAGAAQQAAQRAARSSEEAGRKASEPHS